jgi:hypothetical protein
VKLQDKLSDDQNFGRTGSWNIPYGTEGDLRRHMPENRLCAVLYELDVRSRVLILNFRRGSDRTSLHVETTRIQNRWWRAKETDIRGLPLYEILRIEVPDDEELVLPAPRSRK